MPPRHKAVTKPSETNRIQRLCGFAFFLIILFQTPLFEAKFEDNSGRAHRVPLSPVETSSLALLDLDDGAGGHWKTLAQAMLVPGAWLKLLTRTAHNCLHNRGCTIDSLLHPGPAWKRADYTQLLSAWKKFSPKWQTLLSSACGGLVVCALALPVAPGNKMVMVVMLQLFVACLLTGATPLPTSLFLGVLAGTAVFGKAKERPVVTPAPGSGMATPAATKKRQ